MFDTDDKGERSRKAYREGAEASKSSGFWGHFWHTTPKSSSDRRVRARSLHPDLLNW